MMFLEPPEGDEPRRRRSPIGTALLVVVIIASLAATADVAGLVDVPLIPTRHARTEHAGWPGDGPAPSPPPAEQVAPAPAPPTADPDPAPADADAEPDPEGPAPADDEARGLVLSGDGAGAVFYVDNTHPDASDSHIGTSEDAPWRTVVHAAATVRAGQTVYVKEGVYDDGQVEVTHSGQPGAPIVLAAHPGDERKVELTDEGIVSVGNSHLEIRGFHVTHSRSYGIRVEGPEDPSAPAATDIVIADNHTYDTCSSGISVWGVDWGDDPGDYDNIRNVDIEHNLLELGTNGCRNEIITVANGAVNVDVRYNTIRIGDPTMEDGDEGIDFKEGVRDSRIYGNEIYDLSDKAIYIDGGSADADSTRLSADDPFVRNISIYDNHMYDLPSAGVSIVTEGKGDVDGIYVFNNVVHDVDGDGILVYDHPGGRDEGGTVRNVHIVNNTVYNAGLRHGGYGGIRVNHERADGILVRNNIAWSNNGYDIRGESETTIDHNLCREGDRCETTADPAFADAAARDFRLQAESLAIDAGASQAAPPTDHEANSRPQGVGIDLGAHEAAGATSEPRRIIPGGTVAVEGDGDLTELVVPVVLSSPATEPVTATWRIHDYQAQIGDDLVDAAGVIEFAPGQTETSITVQVRGDTTPEDDEIFFIVVREPTGAIMGGFWGLGIGVIQNDD